MSSTQIAVAADRNKSDTYEVAVRQGGSRSDHRVTFDDWGRKTAAAHDCPPERLVEACFRFLLDREPKESILPSFPLETICRYFPEVDERIGGYLR